MSQRSVERIIGRLVTDEGYRRRYWQDREKAIREVASWGCELNECEWRALTALQREPVERFAGAIDPRIQKTDIEGGER